MRWVVVLFLVQSVAVADIERDKAKHFVVAFSATAFTHYSLRVVDDRPSKWLTYGISALVVFGASMVYEVLQKETRKKEFMGDIASDALGILSVSVPVALF